MEKTTDLAREKDNFRRMCSGDDWKIIREGPRGPEDFIRLCYILHSLQYESMEEWFFDRYQAGFPAVFDKVLETETYERWLRDFAKNVPGPRRKKRVMELFGL